MEFSNPATVEEDKNTFKKIDAKNFCIVKSIPVQIQRLNSENVFFALDTKTFV